MACLRLADDPLDSGLRRNERKILKLCTFQPLPPAKAGVQRLALLRFGDDHLDSGLRRNERKILESRTFQPLTPAQAGVQRRARQGLEMIPWIPAFAGMSG